MSKVVCAISGGVDSAVAALLLKRRGFDVIGAFMRNWDVRDETGHCASDEDYHYAERVCDTLKIPFHEVNFVKEYWTNVFQETVEEYESGRTPNPDVLCNKYVKFSAFYKYAKERLNVPIIATGHYARTSENFSRYSVDTPESRNNGKLYQAVDKGKCQTFFLNRISSEVVKNTIFPIGSMLKKAVKDYALLNNLAFAAERKESMGICFIGLRDFDKFIADYIIEKHGNFVCLETGDVLCEHSGYFKYTLGQRARIAINNLALYVAGKNVKAGDVYVVPGTLHHALFSKAIVTEKPHWIGEIPASYGHSKILKCGVRVMHREPIIDCEIHAISDTHCLMILQRPLRAITPGQSAVIYSGLQCLGGTKICHTGPSFYESYEGYPKWSPFRNDTDLWDGIFEQYGCQILPDKTDKDNMANFQNILDAYTVKISS